MIELFSVVIENASNQSNSSADLVRDLNPINQLVPLKEPGLWLSEGSDPSWELPALAIAATSVQVSVTLLCRPTVHADPHIPTVIRSLHADIRRLNLEISNITDLATRQVAITEQSTAHT
jgi:hypothetical protein